MVDHKAHSLKHAGLRIADHIPIYRSIPATEISNRWATETPDVLAHLPRTIRNKYRVNIVTEPYLADLGKAFGLVFRVRITPTLANDGFFRHLCALAPISSGAAVRTGGESNVKKDRTVTATGLSSVEAFAATNKPHHVYP
ncbi:hypothetical protein VE03_10893 [Pseudogymnoascus sp. 23342-1-I1]|nr:hypothetical protein VE03_10893 [Pseudogymnoascus sp. 23342-1-I1]